MNRRKAWIKFKFSIINVDSGANLYKSTSKSDNPDAHRVKSDKDKDIYCYFWTFPYVYYENEEGINSSKM